MCMLYIYILEAKGGGRKLALQNGKVEGSEEGKNTALFLEEVKETSRWHRKDPPAEREMRER